MNRLFLTLIFLWIATLLPAQDTVRRLTQDEAMKAALAKPQPDYPPVARQLRIQGRIELEVTIETSGSVENVKVLSGNPALTGTAVNALKHWRFEPVLSDGKPVRAVAAISFTFKL
jgi:TonB family protein